MPGSKAETREDGNMRRSLTRIRTSHVGRLPPPKGWADMPARLAGAEITDPVVIAAKVTPAIAETVKKQIETAIDCIGDGEFLDGAQSRPLRRPLHRCRGAHRRAECRKAISRPSSGSSRILSMKQRAAIPMLWPPALSPLWPKQASGSSRPTGERTPH